MSLDLTTLAVAKAYTDKKNLQGGGGVTPTAAEKIVDYTVGTDEATAKSFSFTVEEYPKLAEYNRLRGIFRRSANGSTPWVQIVLNTTDSLYSPLSIGKTAAGNLGMCGFDITRKGSYYKGGISSLQNISLYTAWTTEASFPNAAVGRFTPLYIADLTMITIGSYQQFLDEGGRIEIWGWNE